MTQQGNYQQPAPVPQHQPVYPQQAKPEISDMIVGKGKLDLFLMGGGLLILLGLLFLDLLRSGAVDPSETLSFLGLVLFHTGIIALISLLLVAGIVRDDIPENTRTMMIRASGLIAAAFIFATALGFLGFN